MSIEFEKVGSRVLIVDDDKVMASLPVDAGIIADPDKPDLVMFSNDLDAVDNESAVRVNWKKVTTPAVTDRDDLIRQLTADFFFRVATASGSYTRYIVPIEQIDGRLTIEVPNEVDLTKDTIVVEGKFTHTPDIDYTIENVAGKGNFTFTLAPTELTVIRYIKK